MSTCVEIVSPPQTSLWRSWHGICQVAGPDGSAQAGAAYEVSTHLISVLAVLLGSRSAAAVLLPGGPLNFSDAQIKRSTHAG